MKRLLSLLVVLAPLMAAAAGPAPGPRHFEGELVPLNGSLVAGTVRAALDGGELTLVLEVEGLEPMKLHAQHLHGFFGADRPALCPGVEADRDGDQVLDAEEARVMAGAPLLPLEPFPLPADDGPLRYEATFKVDPEAIAPLEARVVMLHGLTLDGAYQRGLPVACAHLQPANAGGGPPPVERVERPRS